MKIAFPDTDLREARNAVMFSEAHLFWWLYKSPYRVEDPSKRWPVILWLQGGPGASGVGLGNFLEIGPLDGNLKPRNSTWLQKVDLLFVDSPVIGTGYSYVDDHNSNLTVKTNVEAAIDVTTLLKEVFNGNESLQQSPLYVVAESYGGKFAVTVCLSVLEAIEAGQLKLKLGGVALGDSWISSEDFVLSWGPLLKDTIGIHSLTVTPLKYPIVPLFNHGQSSLMHSFGQFGGHAMMLFFVMGMLITLKSC